MNKKQIIIINTHGHGSNKHQQNIHNLAVERKSVQCRVPYQQQRERERVNKHATTKICMYSFGLEKQTVFQTCTLTNYELISFCLSKISRIMENFRLCKPTKSQPSERASLLSRFFFCWAPPIFFRRRHKNSEFYAPLKSHTSSHLGDKFQQLWEANPNLWHVIWRIFRLEFLSLATLFILSEFTLKLSQPWLIGKLIDHYVSNSSDAYFYGSLIILTSFSNVLLTHYYQLHIQHLGMKIRVGCCSLIYRKSLKLSNQDSNTGKVINLLSNDVARFNLAAMHLIQLVAAPLETLFIVYCLYVIAGITSVAGIVLLILFIPTQILLGKLTTKYRQKTTMKTDQRLRLVDEVLSGIQAIKMFTWERLFEKMIAEIRRLEIRQIMKASFIRAFNSSSMLFLNRCGIFLCVVVHFLVQKELSAKYVFVVSSLYALLRQTMTVYFPFSLQNFCETRVTVARIEKFLTDEQTAKEATTYVPRNDHDVLIKTDEDHAFEKIEIWLENVSSGGILKNINLKVTDGETVMITGCTGAGKSAILFTILQELPLKQGHLKVSGRVSYASQEPWLFPGTIRQNILFGGKLNPNRYQKVVQICQLERDFSSFANGDDTYVGESGGLLSGGQKSRVSLARALYKDADIYLLDNPLAAVDAKVGRRIFQEGISAFLKDKCVVFVANDLSYSTEVDRIYELRHGELVEMRSCEKVDDVSIRHEKNSTAKKTQIGEKKLEKAFDDEKNTNHVYRKYVAASGKYFLLMLIFTLFAFTQVAASGADYFVAYWSKKMETAAPKSDLCIHIYTGLVTATVLLPVLRSIIFFQYCIRASTKLHLKMFTRVIEAPMDFFKATPKGKILNRFAKDVGYIDEFLPLLLMDTIQIAFIVSGSLIIIVYLNPLIIFPTMLMLGLFYFIKKRFLLKSRDMKRLEAEARSPLYSHVNTTIEGLPTIRVHNVQRVLNEEFDHLQDLHSSAFYTFMTCNRAFGFWLDMISVIYAAIAITVILVLDVSASDIGLGITQSINLIGLIQWGIRQWSELENQMVSVERVVEYTEIPQEQRLESENEEFLNWPKNGEIKFESLSLKYLHSDRYSLNDVNLVIKSKEKIGVVGRTGSGKTSLISALFRLFPTTGRILIDNVNIQTVPLNILRSQICVIPQEPILFSGSLRDNVDPHHEFGDEIIWKVLEQVELKNTVQDLYTAATSFSVGEKQLVCLSRALLRKKKIIVMDEPTANLDAKTDCSIQRIIRKNFEDCTVVTVAHRLNAVMECDRILVMDEGKVAEFDCPRVLLQNTEGPFSQLVKEYGSVNMETLK